MKRINRAWMWSLAPLAVAAALSGCASKVKLDEPAPVETRNPAMTTPPPATNQSQVATVDLGRADAQAFAGLPRVVYFDYDSYVVKDDYRPVIEGFAKALSANRGKKIAVEGHTDDRGGREYNLALGQKRADAVARSLVLLGVSDGQVEAVSFGKERPAVQGDDETSWAKNRRAELKDR